MPCRPAHRELLVHHALEPLRAQGLDALDLLPFKLLLGETLELSLAARAVQRSLAQVRELLAQLAELQLRLAVAMLLVGQLLCDGHRLELDEFCAPAGAPVSVRCDELGLGQARARRLEHIESAHLFGPHRVPARPAHRELLIHHALESLAAERLDALLLLLLELLLRQAHDLALASRSRERRLARVLELQAQRVELLHGELVLGLFLGEQLVRRLGRLHELVRRPQLLPL